MSREFGEYHTGGYFHEKIGAAAKDCSDGDEEITRLWGEFLEEFEHVAFEIANAEACDMGPGAPVVETIRRLPILQEHLDKIKRYVAPIEDAISLEIRRITKSKTPTKEQV